MTLNEARVDLSKKLADAINESKLNPTTIRLILADLDNVLAQLEEQQYQSAIAEKEGEDA